MVKNLPSGVSISIESHAQCWQRDIAFLHGNLASRRWWYPSIEVMKSMGGGAGTAHLLEFPGCGEAPAPKSLQEVNMFRWAENFCSVLEQTATAPMDLVGHSTGGLVAALMLAHRPDLFHRAVLLDPVGATGVHFEESMHGAFAAMKSDRELTATVIGSTIYGNKPESLFFQNSIVPDAFHAVGSVGAWVLQALDGLDIRNQLKTVSSPVLVLHGEHDALLPVADSEALAALLPQGQFEIFAGAGHCANVELPKNLVEKMRSFLA